MARLPVSPRLARMLLEGHRLGQAEAVALAAALLSERDPFGRGEDACRHESSGGGRFRFGRVRSRGGPGRFRRVGAGGFALGTNPSADGPIRAARPRSIAPRTAAGGTDRQRRGDAETRRRGDSPSRTSPRLRVLPVAASLTQPGEAVRRGLLAAFPDRLVRRSGPGSRFGRMVGGRGVRVVDSSAVRNAPLFLAVDVDRGGVGSPGPPGLGRRARLARGRSACLADRGRVRRGEPAA